MVMQFIYSQEFSIPFRSGSHRRENCVLDVDGYIVALSINLRSGKSPWHHTGERHGYLWGCPLRKKKTRKISNKLIKAAEKKFIEYSLEDTREGYG